MIPGAVRGESRQIDGMHDNGKTESGNFEIVRGNRGRSEGSVSLGKNIFIYNMYHSFEIHTQMGENMKKIVFALALVAVICVCSTASISAEEEERSRFHFRTINFPNDTFTQLLGINDSEMIAGYHGAATNVGFVFLSRNSFTLENFPNSAQTQVIGINNRGYTDGFYIDPPGINHAFLHTNAPFTTAHFPAPTPNQLL